MPIHRQRVMAQGFGDVCHEFDTTDRAAVDAAMLRFNELVGTDKMVPYAKGEGGNHTLLRAFDPTVEETAFRTQLEGG